MSPSDLVLSRRNVLLSALAAGTALAVGPARTAGASPAGILIPGGRWLQGRGVDVMGNGLPGNGVSFTTKWQCAEIVQRLHIELGWSRIGATDGGAHTIPEGSPGLRRHNPGSGYVPVPGDLIIEHATSFSQYGHVAIVDRVEGDRIITVEQNASADGWHVYSFNGSRYRGGYGAVKAVLHDPANTFRNPTAPVDPTPVDPTPTDPTPVDPKPTVPGAGPVGASGSLGS